MQSRMQTTLEVCSNTFIGMAGSWALTWLCLTLYEDRTQAATASVLYCTVWSLVRGWVIRRTFNKMAANQARKAGTHEAH